jgi:hypothetical protein
VFNEQTSVERSNAMISYRFSAITYTVEGNKVFSEARERKTCNGVSVHCNRFTGKFSPDKFYQDADDFGFMKNLKQMISYVLRNLA